MSYEIPQDTPIDRTSIRDMEEDDLNKFVGYLQEKRLRAYNSYKAGLELKAKKTEEKDKAFLEKRLSQFPDAYDKALKALNKVEKIVVEIQAARLMQGDTL